MATKKNESLAPVGTFAIANRYEGMDPDLLAELEDQLDDLDDDNSIICRTIKVPAGGALAFEVQTGDDPDDLEYMKQLSGVIVFTHRLNARWAFAYGEGDDDTKSPDCSSMDGKIGINSTTGEAISCDTCPFNEYGSGINKDGTASRGKACKNMRRIYLMMDGDPNFYLLTVPPTSIRDVNKQLKRIIAGGVPYTGMVVTFALSKEKNRDGIEFSKVSVAKKELLPREAATAALQLRAQIKQQYKAISVTYVDYSQGTEETSTVAPGEFTDVEPVSSDEPLPFT